MQHTPAGRRRRTDGLNVVEAAVQRLDVGILHINSEPSGADPHVPLGGSRHIGFGPREQGRALRDFFTTTTTAYVRGSRTVTR